MRDPTPSFREPALNRRSFLRAGAIAGGSLAALTLLPRQIRALHEASAGVTGSLDDVEHIVVLMQENRSFDHYFGTFPGCRGFDDPNLDPTVLDGILHQPGYDPQAGAPAPDGRLYPYRLDTRQLRNDAWCTNDIDHSWAVQHASWRGGAMDGFLTSHLEANGAAIGPVTMGYYNGADLRYYHALASAFTLLDGYHCSVIGPTDPNRLVAMSGTLDPDGEAGGPILSTHLQDRASYVGSLGWTTMPEVLQDAGVSWKVYQTADGEGGDNVLYYFDAYTDPTSELFRRGLTPAFPADFVADVATGNLPEVSWILASLAESEHPGAPPPYGEMAVAQVLDSLARNPEVWRKTALLVTYDENGGFFDHVAPPTPPPGTAGEHVTVDPLPADAGGVRGPVGLGFRVPAIVVSPFSRGGRIVSDTLDHTSILQLLSARFGVDVPNVSAWRRGAVGDLTSAFRFDDPDPTVPRLPEPDPANPATLRQCAVDGGAGTADHGETYPVPYPNPRPHQGGDWESGDGERNAGTWRLPGPPPQGDLHRLGSVRRLLP